MQQIDMFEMNAAQKYDAANPQIWVAFKSIAFRAIKKGFKHYGAQSIFEVLRWETGVTGDDEFKINNNYGGYYARKFIKLYPEHENFFRLRKSKWDES